MMLASSMTSARPRAATNSARLIDGMSAPYTPEAKQPAAAAPAAPAASAPMAPLAPSPIAPTAPGAAKIVDPGMDSMAGLQAAAGDMGSGDMSAGAGDNIGGPSMFRQGIGSRIPPQYSASLAALRQVY